MNKTININLGGYFFHIDESAYQKLRTYLDAIARSLSEDPQGKNEIIADIEARISELLSEKIADSRQVVNEQDISDIIKIMGEPEDYTDSEETFTDNHSQYTRTSSRSKKLFRDGDDKLLGGVAAGIAHYFGIDVIWTRLAFILFFISGFSIVCYIILWILLPEAKTTAEKLQMEGEAVNISNIEKKIREEFNNVKDRFKEGAENVSEKFSDIEKKYKPKAKSGFQDFLDTLGNILVKFFKIIGKLIGVLIIIISASVLILFILGIFSIGSFSILGFKEGYMSLPPFMIDSVLPEWLLATCLLVLVGFPFLILFMLGLRILSSNVKRFAKTTSLTFLGLWITALLIVIFTGIEFSASHARSGSTIKKDTISIQPNDTLHIRVVNDDDIFYQDYLDRTKQKEEVYVNGNTYWYSNYVKVDVRKSKNRKSYVEVRRRSQGRTMSNAQENASKIQFKYEVAEHTIVVDGFFLSSFSNFSKDETVYFTLYLQEEVMVYFDESSGNFLNNVENTQNISDQDMIDHYFMMTDKGLDCSDCEIPEEEESQNIKSVAN